MSPTVFREGRFRFYFFSREERRRMCTSPRRMERQRFWLRPAVELAVNHGLSDKDLRDADEIIVARLQEILDAWNRHFSTAS